MPTPLDDRDPRWIGPYRLLERLGEGGQGVVYLAEAPDGRKVAVKTLKLEGLSPDAEQEARRRLAKEVEAAKRVDPFCTARVLDFSVEGPVCYVVSEYVEGPSLYERVERQGPLDEDALIRLIIQSVSGLTAIHNAGIVHRDLKPSNLLLGPDGARVVDFGIARPAESRTHTGRLIGTPAYFSPEQLAGQPATMASDVFAWAGTMVFAATGRTPFGHADYNSEMPALFRRIMEDEPDLRGVPERVLPLLELCLDKDPGRRPAAWSILGWLLGRRSPDPASPAPVPLPSDRFTKGVDELLSNAPQGGTPIQLPPPAPPPAVGAVPFPGYEPFAPDAPSRREMTPPPGSGPVPPAGGEQTPPAGREPVLPAGDSTVPPAEEETVPPPGGPAVPAAAGRPASRPQGRPRPLVPAVAVVLLVLAVAGVLGWRMAGSGGAAGLNVPEDFAGTWQGTASEGDGFGSDTTEVTLSLPAGQETGTLSGSRCAGRLAVDRVEGDRMYLRITSGPCENGEVLVSRAAGDLRYALRGGGHATGDGTLRRSGA